MFQILQAKGLIKVKNHKTSNLLFTLTSSVTVLLLVTFAILITTSQYFGQPVLCSVSDDNDDKLIDNYCWIHSTYTVVNKTGIVGKDVLYPGVAPHVEGKDQVIYHNYYQWIFLVLWIQAACFYLPRLSWKFFEGGRIKLLTDNFRKTDTIENGKRNLAKYILECEQTNINNWYALKYYIHQILILINVIFWWYYLDDFFEGKFNSYGWKALGFYFSKNPEENPIDLTFPRMAKCTFNKYGPSGGIIKVDAICVLSLNILNEKIFLFLWLWFPILITICVVNYVFEAIIMLIPPLRWRYLVWVCNLGKSEKNVVEYIKKCKIGDIFVLYFLHKNIDGVHYKEVLKKVAKDKEESEPRQPLII